MGVKENGDLSPDGVSLSWTPSIPRLGMLGIGGTYYWNPGSDTAPSRTCMAVAATCGNLGRPWQASTGAWSFEETG